MATTNAFQVGESVNAKTSRGWEKATVTRVNGNNTYDVQFSQSVGKAWVPGNLEPLDSGKPSAKRLKVPFPGFGDEFGWDDKLLLGHEGIDKQHMDLFALLGFQLENPGNEENWKNFCTYLTKHNNYEDDLFTNYSKYSQTADGKQHMATHVGIIANVNSWTLPLDEETIEWLKQWYIRHVFVTDRRYIPFKFPELDYDYGMTNYKHYGTLNHLDKNNDGTISIEEYQEWVKETKAKRSTLKSGIDYQKGQVGAMDQ
jgi:hemerythrin